VLELNSLVVCEKVGIDVFTERWFYISVIDSLILPQMEFEYEGEMPESLREAKYMLPRMVICSTLIGTEADFGEYHFRLTIVAPDGKETEFHSDQFAMSTPYHRLVTNFGPGSGRLSGVYAFKCSIKSELSEPWKFLGMIKFHVLELQMPFQGVTPPEISPNDPPQESNSP